MAHDSEEHPSGRRRWAFLADNGDFFGKCILVFLAMMILLLLLSIVAETRVEGAFVPAKTQEAGAVTVPAPVLGSAPIPRHRHCAEESADVAP